MDSAGTILESTLEISSFVSTVIGFNVRDVLSKEEHKGFMASTKIALKTHKIAVIDYHLQGQLHTAIIEPIDTETFYLHEHKVSTQEKDAITAVLMGFVQRRAV